MNSYIAHFRLIEKLESSWLAEHYKAYDESLQREVAIKVVKPDLFLENQLWIVQQQIQQAALIQHPHVAQIYFFGLDMGSFYIVLEYSNCQNLEDLLTDRIRLPESMVLSLAIEICEGLKAAVQQGVYHGNLTPKAILLDDTCGIKITGFEFSKIQAAVHHGYNDPAADYRFVSPEHVKNVPEDQTSDIYSLGLIMYMALAGHAPFGGKTPQNLALKRLDETLPDLSAVAAGISGQTSRIVSRMTRREKIERYQDYDELLHDLTIAQRHSVNSNKNNSLLDKAEKLDPFRKTTSSKRQKVKTNRKPHEKQARQLHRRKEKIGVVLLIAVVVTFFLVKSLFLSSKQTFKTLGIKFQPDPGNRNLITYQSKTYLVDAGELFGRKKNGYTYGWNVKPDKMGNRQGIGTPGWFHESFAAFPDKGDEGLWEILVPDGKYKVRLVVGDMQFYWGSILQIAIEDQEVLSGIRSVDRPYLERSCVVEVKDGRLSARKLSGRLARLCFLEISQTDESLTPPLPKINLSVSKQKVIFEEHEPIIFIAEIVETARQGIQKVAFYNSNILLGEVSTSPYLMHLTELSIGKHWIRAEGILNDNTTFVSPPVTINVLSRNDDQLQSIKVNFQSPPEHFLGTEHKSEMVSLVNKGYLLDFGKPFGLQSTAFNYGWNKDISQHLKYSYSTEAPDFRYGTSIPMVASSKSNSEFIWEMEIPNGRYQLRVVAGNPIAPDSGYYDKNQQTIFVEGNPVIDTQSKINRVWIDVIVPVEIKDGRLTLSSKDGTLTKLCFIEAEKVK